MNLPNPPVSIAGLSREEAVERVLAELDGEADPDAVRAAVDRVAGDDGVVSRAAAESALGHCSKVVTTAESRTEFARDAVETARAAAADAPDLPAVEARTADLAEELATVEDRTEGLAEDLGTVVDRLDGASSPYPVGVGIRRLEARANDLARAADRLADEAGTVERWCEDPELRREELAADLDAVEEFLDGIASTLDALPADGDGDAGGGSESGRDGNSPAGDPPLLWFDAALRHRVVDPLLADVRAELGDLRAWGERADGHGFDDAGTDDADDRMDGLAARIDGLDDRRAALEDRLDGAAREEGRARFGDRLATFEDELAGAEPPVDWGTVLATLEEHRPEVDGEVDR